MKKSHQIKDHTFRSITGGRERPRFADELAERRSEEAFNRWGKFEDVHLYPPATIQLEDGTMYVFGQESEKQARER